MSKLISSLFISALLCVLCTVATGQSTQVQGIVRDATGAAVAGASVTLQAGTFRMDRITDATGAFSFIGIPAATGTVEVQAQGFRLAKQSWNAGAAGSVKLEIVLAPASANEELNVSAARTELRLAETPGSTILLSTADLSATPAVRVDDALRQVPGFSLFRRSDSSTANASNQGVSLRGLGGSASSRALVLEGGLPLVDAFGGWVYWDRVPREEISSVEVFRGGASNLYGSDALGGVVQFISRQPEAPAMALETSYGNQRTPDLSLWTGTRSGPWDLSAATEMFRSDGYIVVPTWQRGIVDTPANSKDAAVDVNVGHQLGANGRVFLRGNYYTEFRHNGTPVQTNDTHTFEGAFGLDKQFRSSDTLMFRAYGQVLGYDQRFSSIATNRASESLTDLQYVPEQVGGGAVQWTHIMGAHQTLIGGGDLLEVMGSSNEQFFSSGTNTRDSISGGRQRIIGVFGEDLARFNRWTIILGGRVDDWNNFNASFICTPVSGSCTSPSTLYPQRSDLAFSPRLSVLRSLPHNFAVTGSMYRSFRAPTLNELYRSFRMANVLTLNNPALTAERLTGAEAGLKYTSTDHKLELRGNLFWSDIVDPVQNVTTDPTSNPVLREKENVGRIRARGAEFDGVLHLTPKVQLTAGYELTQSTIVNYTVPTGEVSLLGKVVAQVPHNVFTWQARYSNPSRLILSVEGRFVGNQFDDDLNQYPLGRAYTMDVQIGRNLTKNLELFAAAENIFDDRYYIANTPTSTGSLFNIGPPTLFRVGLRLNLPAEK